MNLRVAHDPETPEALIAFMQGDWLDRPHDERPHRLIARFRERRAALSRSFPDHALVIPAGEERVRANDTFYRFRASSDFAYLAGPQVEPGTTLVLEPRGDGTHTSVLFTPAHNRGTAAFFTDRVRGELWVGRHRGVEESAVHHGVDRARPLDDRTIALQELRARGIPIALVRGPDRELDALLPSSDDDALLAVRLAEARLLKDDDEIAELRTAITITKRGFEDVLRILPSARSEREVEAAFWRRARIEANDVGYLTIAAAGEHACTLHWNRNTGALRPGDLLLLDAGVECDSLYTADITRTIPISGRFSPEQRAVYEIVHLAQRAAMEAVRPGNDFLEPNRRAMAVLAQGLRDLGVLRCSVDEALDPERQYYRRYTLHNVSHMLGLDVHDCAKARAKCYRYGTLRERMVLTVEPGLYFQPDDATVPERLRGIGVRIEDDVLVTADGYENLSAALPADAASLEAWCAILQTPGCTTRSL
jgi:Xaa-Pro aminopeptidase